ncbi:dihydrolipoyllysine-residue succinyltransferase [Candidatus Tachikawaea gelatinosa]|uniref:Dihydrolipoyllysine-residue succinyltransferase n=1 Tax=Candidatus Tachikawaea gelatinosa TaxID=1410383 RepID=A0A090AQG8_9ENTR|nr:dihydrolipoyllysine-residue succinyltransferase [Candidatus Tachikawaea gelatinosa]BAP58592.1 dihydrolipoamide succinyltransferase component (E2) [Candidatus Tachikawaea gelatinosa]
MSLKKILVPDLPESINVAKIIKWYKKVGQKILSEDILVSLETDKVILEISADCNGFLKEIVKKEGDNVTAKEIIGFLTNENFVEKNQYKNLKNIKKKENNKVLTKEIKNVDSPSVRRMLSKNEIDINQINQKNKSNRITKTDIREYLLEKEISCKENNRKKRRIPMTFLRKRIAERLLSAQKNAAILTTFNEVNMEPLLNFREKYRKVFEKKYEIKLGLMSFFMKASVIALKRFPKINASIDKSDIIFYDYFDINFAISTKNGLVVPILKNVDLLNLVDLEKSIKEIINKAHEDKLNIEDLISGNFTVTNGGVFGSLMSTPIINPPQSAILAMHAIQDRPVVKEKKIHILPMMYIALSYDHRIVDGKESIGFLMTIKEMIEDPIQLLMNF